MTDETVPRYWNIWWTLTVISLAATIIAGVLEALGIWNDVGLGVGFVGLALSIGFGLTAATRTAVVGVDRRLDQMHDTLKHMLLILDQRLPDRKP
jgi:hypothetical protein